MDDKVKVLLCEDDEYLGTVLCEYLSVKNYDVTHATDGEMGKSAFMSGTFDVCILDVMMPKLDGFALATEIRQINKEIPIIFLTAKTMKEDVINGFKIGADDYVTKPFSMEELTLRIEAIMRHVNHKRDKAKTKYQIGSFLFDTQKQVLIREGEPNIKLTTKENDLLSLLCKYANEILARDFALKSIWIEDSYFNARSMDVYVTKLRKHLKGDPEVEILNVHGKGYKLVVPNEDI
ncbi:MAG: response regulator transcription factor [Bacteroidales bacterium]|nr:response regulator transcription factor [Bacteroidales bacterium]